MLWTAASYKLHFRPLHKEYVNHFLYGILHILCLVVDVNQKVTILNGEANKYVDVVSRHFYHLTIYPLVNLAALSLKVRTMLLSSIQHFFLGGTYNRKSIHSVYLYFLCMQVFVLTHLSIVQLMGQEGWLQLSQAKVGIYQINGL